MSDPTQPVQRRFGGAGGSFQTVLSRRPVRESRSTLDRATDTLGADVVNDLQTT
ncbi:hypothetical protein F441_22376 [Phytophthora nicotianae CJ01A1]|uniref:Uncharacterized protein n=3 Tax=Phytophthora nicotianae TaxID=4792 RepID=W2Y0A8_PHYNI|nr:hypothetical protein F444_23208 [Phytophthora nicotianae P1976]ETP00206.1 hypothetical protein F441_22376 [Phytophthora nicotianae CJ01A1]ETP27619.1 hypothetical protein F442_23105 [Phytophthora nicotianae P10297]